MPETLKPILYSFRRCPYAMRARMALVAGEQPVELREILLRDKPAEMLAASPKATVPVLVMADDSILEESLDIMLWALNKNDPQNWLSPQQGSLEDMLRLIEEIDGDFKHHLDNYKYSARHAGSEEERTAHAQEHRSAAIKILAQLDEQLAKAPFLFGSKLSLADVAIAPFVRQFTNTDIDWFNAQPYPHLQAWLREFLAAPLFASIMSKYKPWAPGADTPPFPPAHQNQLA
ncbi:MAG: glutathione S-transferase [Rhizobiaceae bacterium]|nr:glutathione S-transferase [Rhizobiaceae bacterium]